MSKPQDKGPKEKPVESFPPVVREEYTWISPEGQKKLLETVDPKDPDRNTVWTTDIEHELPITVKARGSGSFIPITLPEKFKKTCEEFPRINAYGIKVKGKWNFTTYETLYQEALKFSSAMVSFGVPAFKAVTFIGFNHPAWFIGFYGCWQANVIPVGVYTTNAPDACKYIADHADSYIAVVENQEHLDKYLAVWDQLPNLKYVIVYSDPNPKVPENRKAQVLQFSKVLEIGAKFMKDDKDVQRQERLKRQKPGNCCTLVYTSGTTGNPKGVMLSHDTYTWLSDAYHDAYHEMRVAYPPGSIRVISYLPLSHVAAQFSELVLNILSAGTLYFAEPTALQDTLIDTLKEVRPTHFVSVPRIWEKMEESIKRIGKSKGFPLKNIADWAKSIGVEGTFADMQNTDKPFMWDLAKKLVYGNVKKALGLDKCAFNTYGAAPLSLSSRTYFASLNLYLVNSYGMSENAGPTTMYNPFRHVPPSLESAGHAIPGTELHIHNPDKDGNGEICMRGRHRFMGYLNDVNATRSTIDSKGYLHSGDVGKIDKYGHLYITGRIKELLITAGGENVAPILIETEIKTAIPEISCAVVVGDNRKFLTVLLTLKHKQTKAGYPEEEIDPLILKDLKEKGIEGTTPKDFRANPKFVAYIEAGLAKANEKGISKAQTVRKWYLLDRDFSIENDEVTPTLKLKRAKIYKRYPTEIESMYPPEPKL